MEKFVMSIRVTPKTREKLETLRKDSGLSYGVLIDIAVAVYAAELVLIKNKNNGINY